MIETGDKRKGGAVTVDKSPLKLDILYDPIVHRVSTKGRSDVRHNGRRILEAWALKTTYLEERD